MPESFKVGYSEGEISPEVLRKTRERILQNFQALRQKIFDTKNIKAEQAIGLGLLEIEKVFDLRGKPKPPIWDAVISGSKYRMTDEASELEIQIIDLLQSLIVRIEGNFFSGDSEERS